MIERVQGFSFYAAQYERRTEVGEANVAGISNARENEPASPSVNSVRILPCDSNELIRNPGKGYVLYDLETKVPELWNTAVAGYVIRSWQTIQPSSENNYNWSVFDGPLGSCRDHGIQLTIGVLCADSSDNQPLDVPLRIPMM
jgi:hypothetical protein